MPEAPKNTITPAAATERPVQKKIVTSHTIISLKEESQEEPTVVEEIRVDYGDEPYDLDNVSGLWPEMVKMFEKQPSFYAALKNRLPEMDDAGNINVVFENNMSLKEFTIKKPEILHFFRSALKNNSFDISGTVAEVEDNTVKPYTAEAKYNRMIEKNPDLKNLKEQLDLDIEY